MDDAGRGSLTNPKGSRCPELALGVPLEIVESYFSFLSPLDLITCSLVCDRWRSIIVSNRLLLSKLHCYDNVSDYPGVFDEDNPAQMKFRLFKNWDYYKRLLLYYNCSAFSKFDAVTGLIQPSFVSTELTTGWTPLKFFLINTKLFSIVVSKRKDRLKLVSLEQKSRLGQKEETTVAELSFAEPCTGCATALVRDQIPLGMLKSFVYVYIMRSHPGVNVTLVSFDSDMSQYVRTDLRVSNLAIDRDLGQGIKFLQVNGLTVLHNFILFEVNCFNLTESRAISYSMVLKIKEIAAMPTLELVRTVQTEQYNLNVTYHCFARKLYILKCSHSKATESVYEAVISIHNEFKSYHVLDTNTRELKYFSFWLNYLLYVDESRKRIHFRFLEHSQKITRLYQELETTESNKPLVSVINGDILSIRTQMNFLFVHLSMGIATILVYRVEELVSRKNSRGGLVASPVTDFAMNKHCKDVDVIGCHGKHLSVVLH